MRELNIAIIGGRGFMGKAHSLAWALAQLELTLGVKLVKKVLVDVSDEMARAAATELGWLEHSSDWKKTIARDDIHIIDIVTPPILHKPIAIAAAEAGKHVFCEKPMTALAADADEMWEAAKKAGVVNQVGFCYRHAPAIVHTHELVSSGRIGKPIQFRTSYLMDYAFSESGWGRAKGAIGSHDDIGTHIIDMAQFILGDIKRVSGRLSTTSPELVKLGEVPDADGEFAVDDSGVFLVEFESGAIGTFSHSLLAFGRKNEIQFELDASRGALEFDWNHRDEMLISLPGKGEAQAPLARVHMGPEHKGSWWPQAGMGSGYLEGHVEQLRHFVTAIVEGTQAHPNFGEAAHVQRVANAVVESSKSGSWVDVAPCDPVAKTSERKVN